MQALDSLQLLQINFWTLAVVGLFTCLTHRDQWAARAGFGAVTEEPADRMGYAVAAGLGHGLDGLPRRRLLQSGQRQLRTQLIDAAIDPIKNPVAVDTLRTTAERLQQAPQGRIPLQIHALDLQQLRGRGPRLYDKSRREPLVDR